MDVILCGCIVKQQQQQQQRRRRQIMLVMTVATLLATAASGTPTTNDDVMVFPLADDYSFQSNLTYPSVLGKIDSHQFDDLTMPKEIFIKSNHPKDLQTDVILKELPMKVNYNQLAANTNFQGKVKQKCFSDGSLVFCVHAINITSASKRYESSTFSFMEDDKNRCINDIFKVSGANRCKEIKFDSFSYNFPEFWLDCDYVSRCLNDNCRLQREKFTARWHDMNDWYFAYDGLYTHKNYKYDKIRKCKKNPLYQHTTYDCQTPPNDFECIYFTKQCPLWDD